MSSLVYGHLASRREASATALPARWVDVVAAVVPAEALALQLVAVDLATTTSRDINGNVITSISSPGLLRVAFVILLVLSGAFYAVSHLGVVGGNRWHTLDWARAAIPPLAFVTWTLAMKASVIDAVAPEVADTTRNVVALVLALLLLAAAYMLAGPITSTPTLSRLKSTATSKG